MLKAEISLLHQFYWLIIHLIQHMKERWQQSPAFEMNKHENYRILLDKVNRTFAVHNQLEDSRFKFKWQSCF